MEQPKELQQPKETEQPVFDSNDEWEFVSTTETNSPASSKLSISMTLDELKSQETAWLLVLSTDLSSTEVVVVRGNH